MSKVKTMMIRKPLLLPSRMLARWRRFLRRLDVVLTTAAALWLLARFVTYVLRRTP